jgi:hypothetical protein
MLCVTEEWSKVRSGLIVISRLSRVLRNLTVIPLVRGMGAIRRSSLLSSRGDFGQRPEAAVPRGLFCREPPTLSVISFHRFPSSHLLRAFPNIASTGNSGHSNLTRGVYLTLKGDEKQLVVQGEKETADLLRWLDSVSFGPPGLRR